MRPLLISVGSGPAAGLAAALPALLPDRDCRLVDHRQALDLAAGVPLLVIVDERDGAALDVLLARIEAEGIRATVAMPFAMIDRVVAAIADPAVDLICEIEPEALAAVLSRPGQASEDSWLAPVRRSIIREDRHGYRGSTGTVSASHIRGVIRARRMRERFFDPALFADPAWDMLLDLAAARLEGRVIAVSSLCIASGVSATTALRWIRGLCARGLFVRDPDPEDARRAFVRLSDEAMTAMEQYFSFVEQSGFPA